MRTKRDCVWYRDVPMFRGTYGDLPMRWFAAVDAYVFIRSSTQAGLRKLIREYLAS